MPPEPSSEPNESISRFERLLVGLAQCGVDYAIVGGLAVILNGYPRVTSWREKDQLDVAALREILER